jgi:hypothetical protein
MDLSKVRGGEMIAAIGGIVLLIALFFFDWYGIGASVSTPIGEFSIRGDFGAWDRQGFFGTLANLVILAAGVAAVGLALLTATSRTVALPVAASALTAALGIAAVVMVLARMLLQPLDNDFVDLKFGFWLAVFGAAGVAIGGWKSMQEEGATLARPSDRPPRGSQTPAPPRAPTEPSEPSGPPGSTPPPPGPPDRQ